MASNSSNSAAHWCKAVIEQAVPQSSSQAASALLYPPPPKPPSSTSAASTTVGATSSTTQMGGSMYAAWGQTPASNPAPAANTAAAANPYAAYMTVSPAYLQFYQQYYQGGAAATPATTATPAAPSTPVNANNNSNGTSSNSVPTPPPPPPPVFNYPSAASTNQPAMNYKAAVTNPPVPAAGWNNGYYMPVTATHYQYGGINIAGLNPIAAANSMNVAASMGYPTAAKKPNPSRFTNANNETVAAPAPPTTAPPGRPQPPALKAFINRCISTCQTDEEREYVSDEISKLIDRVSKEGRLFVHKWDLEPMIFKPKPEPPKAPLFIQTNMQNNNLYMNSLDSANSESRKRKSRWTETPTVASEQMLDSANSKKQKVLSGGSDELLTPEEMKLRVQRASRFHNSAEDFIELESTTTTKFAIKKGNKKNSKFQVPIAPPSTAVTNTLSEIEIANLKVVGTCTKLEKDYLRLTSPPVPEAVRPEHILKKALLHFYHKWENDDIDYVNMCSQMKSIRQDLTVQHIQNDFTVHVYETHARVALESNDLNEYNQCQTQLKALYALNLGNKNEMEFLAYRILYYVYLQGNKKYTGGSSDLASIMQTLKAEAYRDSSVKHALEVRRAIQLDDYHTFFQLYEDTPNMGMYILDAMLAGVRLKALQRMWKTYKLNVGIDFVLQEIGYGKCLEDKLIGIDFMKSLGCVVKDPDGKTDQAWNEEEIKILIWNAKETSIDSSAIYNNENLLL